MILSRGKTIKLLRIEAKFVEVDKMFKHKMNDIICSLTSVNGKPKGKNPPLFSLFFQNLIILFQSFSDYVMVGFESGSVGIFEYDTLKNNLKRVAYFKHGLFNSSIQPQYILIDQTCRTVIMKTRKLKTMVFGLEFGVDGTPTTFTPWNMNESEMMTGQMVCVEVSSFQNPTLASLEVDHISKDTQLQFIKLDLTSKQFKQFKPIPIELDGEINLIVQASGGVLLFNRDMLRYYKPGSEICVIQCLIPFNKTKSGTTAFCASATMDKNTIFALSRNGDIFKIKLEMEDDKLAGMIVNYLDKVTKATDMCVMNSDRIFLFGDFGT